MKNKEYYERAAEMLRYEPETGKLIRRVTTSSRSKEGDEAGTISDRGYLYVSVTLDGKRKLFRSHRIVWFIHHNDIPEMLDHVDGDKLNNRIENLRPATHQQNNQNRQSFRNSTSKYLGVSWSTADKKWRAQINLNRKQKYLGSFDDEIEAAKAYDAASEELFGEFANPNFK